MSSFFAGGLSRRRFVTGLGATGCALSLLEGGAAARESAAGTALHEEELRIERTRVTIDGRTRHSACVNGRLPGPVLRWKEGQDVALTVVNALDEPASIHWHGIRLPADQDGVPGLSFAGIAPGERFTYRFPIRQSGTYWYHSHSGSQEAEGLYGAIVIEPRNPDPRPCARDYVLLLSDWSDVAPKDILSTLKMQDDYYNFRQRSVASLPKEAREKGLISALASRLTWSQMRMSATDISDVSGVIFTYLLNGHSPAGNWSGLFRPGERVRLRIINAASMTFFDVRIPGLTMTVVETDGNEVEPVDVDEFRIGVGETYTLIVEPQEDRAYTIFAQSEDRTGYARGTLTPRAGLSAPVPPMDPRPVRGMVDMGMGMSMDMGMKPAAMKAGMPAMAPARHAPVRHVPVRHAPVPAPEIDDPGPPPLNVENQNVARHPVDRTGSPGDGLENNGRRVLDYRQLKALRPSADPRPPSREIILHLTGNMERYIWGFNGRKFSESGPIRLALNERVRFTIINDTMMEHPLHLHGLWSELENGQGDYRPYKHTIISQPGSRLSFLVTADAPGMWAYHCHLFYHMHMGMFRTVLVS